MCTMQQSASAAAEAAGHHDNASVNPRVLSESLHHYTVSAASADLSLPEPSAAVCDSEQVVHVDQQTRSVFHRLPALRGTSP